MRKTLLLLAGAPGTGKSYFDNEIRKRIPGFVELSIDIEKENLYDTYGFNNSDEKDMLDYEALQLFLDKVKFHMEKGDSIISDYPFSKKQWGTLKRLSDDNNYLDITIVLTADDDVLYERQKKRDLDNSRHLGHLMNTYHKGDTLEDRTKADVKMTKSQFISFIESKKYDEFELGKTFKIDVSDFDKVDYKGTIDKIEKLVFDFGAFCKRIDHTTLSPDATKDDINRTITEAKNYHFCSVMVNPNWVGYVHDHLLDSDVKTATVIGFPLGANTLPVKQFELENAIQNGADELDVVMNVGEFKSKNYEYVEKELSDLIYLGHRSNRVVKVIIETCLLSDDEKKIAAEIVSRCKADFVKTSTGFSNGGANVHDVKILKKYSEGNTLVKASGGIHSLEEAEALIQSGASRLGTSGSVAIVKEFLNRK